MRGTAGLKRRCRSTIAPATASASSEANTGRTCGSRRAIAASSPVVVQKTPPSGVAPNRSKELPPRIFSEKSWPEASSPAVHSNPKYSLNTPSPVSTSSSRTVSDTAENSVLRRLGV